jgi:hypothetical protein
MASLGQVALMMNEKIRPTLQMPDGTTETPTNVEWLIAFAIKGCQWAIDALPEAIRVAELQQCETYNGGCI